MAEWTEIKISINSNDIEKAGDIATKLVDYGIYIAAHSEIANEVIDIAHTDVID